MTAYYNEFNPDAADWLRNLIAAGLIPAGDVDTRSIEDVVPNELRGYAQCHFFAGIGGWPLALRLAGWPDSRPVWTGSCPCQPFSAAGKGAGFADERHLWPHFHWLIAQRRPPVVFGEQVASKDGLAWLDLVQADLEGTGYACGAVDLCAAGVGAPHIRQRLWFVAERLADADHAGSQGYGRSLRQHVPEGRETERRYGSARGVADGMADADSTGSQPRKWNDQGARHGHTSAPTCDDGRLADATEFGRREECSDVGRGAVGNSAEGLAAGLVAGGRDLRPGPTNGQWRAADWLACTDGKWRPVEPRTFPLAHGLPESLGRASARIRELAEVAGLDVASLKAAKAWRKASLHGYGNAIVPQVAAQFIAAAAEVIGYTAQLQDAA